MRKIKGSSSYLKNQVRKNLAKAALSMLIFGVVLFALTLRVLSTLQVGILEEAGLLLSLAPLISFYFYLRKYRIFSGGWEGEKQVAKLLSSKLNDDYYLLNDLYLRDGGGDIDHIVLGPNGVFVLETKNWSGSISCNGDEWQRAGKRNFSGSPSRQVKRNAAKIKQIIDNSPNLRQLGIWVEGIVVFTNNHAALHVNNPTVPIYTLSQLPSHIAAYGSSRRISREKLEIIGKEIVKQKH
ncbi:MAG: NERD domain-containing protein [Chloroflexi bacterium]|nr:NERD domain-containing protein [Chloroflexota bacterium]